MLRKSFALLALSMLLVPALASAQVEKYTVDVAHSEIGFTVRHFVSKVPGRFKQFEGEIQMDPKDPTTMVINGKAKTASISTDNERRDAHLQTPDFFDAANNPEVTFKSKKVTKDGDKYTVLGDLTMRGVTKEVPLQVEVLGVQGNKAGFEATGRVNRKDYGINWNKTLDTGGTVLSDDVDITLRIEANKQEAEAAKK
jgi:polyisoprenoid-binding protein YceI